MTAKATGSIVSFTTENRHSAKTGKTFRIHGVLLSDGQQYEVGFNPLKGYNPGDNISFMWELKFGKRQIQTATITGAGSATSSMGYSDEDGGTAATPAPRPVVAQRPAYTPQTKVFPVPKDHGDRSITRQNALTNAREMVMAMVGQEYFKGDLDAAAERIIQIAYKFEEYTTGDREVNAVKADRLKKAAKVVEIKKAEADDVADMVGADFG